MKSLYLILRASIICVPLLIVGCGGDDNDDEVRALQARLNAIDTQLAGTNGSIADNLSAITDRLTTLENNDTTTAEDIAEIEAMIAALEQRLNAIAFIAEYQVNIVNTTNGQPLSPPAVLLHGGDYKGWSIGDAASGGLENLAESGSPATFISGAEMALASEAGSGVVVPGANSTIDISGTWSDTLQLTVASMLVNTNDAFSGVTGWTIGHLGIGESATFLAPVYDAGTEENDEAAGTIPGPAAGGEGFNSARETRNIVTRHPGVVTQDDGYAESALSEAHRFDNGSMLVTVTRRQ